MPEASTLLQRCLHVPGGGTDEQAALVVAASTAAGALALRMAAAIFCRGREGIRRPQIRPVTDAAELWAAAAAQHRAAELHEPEGVEQAQRSQERGRLVCAVRRLSLAKLFNHRLAARAPPVLAEAGLVERLTAAAAAGPPLTDGLRLPPTAVAALQAALDGAHQAPGGPAEAVREHFGLDGGGAWVAEAEAAAAEAAQQAPPAQAWGTSPSTALPAAPFTPATTRKAWHKHQNALQENEHWMQEMEDELAGLQTHVWNTDDDDY